MPLKESPFHNRFRNNGANSVADTCETTLSFFYDLPDARGQRGRSCETPPIRNSENMFIF